MRVVTNAVRSPVRPATRWMRVVSMALAKVIAGRVVVRRRASIDWPVPGRPSSRRLWSEHPYQISLYRRSGCGTEGTVVPHLDGYYRAIQKVH